MSKSPERVAVGRAAIALSRLLQVPLCRREFLAVAGGLVSSGALAGPIQDTPVVRVAPDPLGGQLLTVSVGGHYKWQLSTRSFKAYSAARGAVRLTYKELEIDKWYVVELKNAAIAGTDCPFQLKITIRNPGNGWRIEMLLNGHRSVDATNGVEPPLLLEWITWARTFEFAGPRAIPATITVGGLRLDSPTPGQAPYIQLRCIGLGDEGPAGGGKDRALQLVLYGSLHQHIRFPGAPFRPAQSSKLAFTQAVMDLLPSVDGNPAIPDEISECRTVFGASAAFDLQKAHTLIRFVEWNAPDDGLPLTVVQGESSGSASAGHRFRWAPDAKQGAFGMLAFDGARGRTDAFVFIGGCGGTIDVAGPGAHPRGTRLHFSISHVFGLAAHLHEIVRFEGALTTAATMFETEHQGFLVQGPSESRPAEPSPVKLDCYRRIRSAAFAVELVRAHVPAAGASLAMVEFPSSQAMIRFGDRADGHAAGESAADQTRAADVEQRCSQSGIRSPVIHFDRTCVFDSPLGDARLTVKRSCDLFDMEFEFRSYWLRSCDGRTQLDRRVPPKYLASCNRPILVAVFPPQHVQEQVFSLTGQNELQELKPPDDLARSLISGRTRIAMEDEGAAALKVFDLTIENLTDWQDLALAVHRRALPRDSQTGDHLAAIGLRTTDSRAAAKANWREAMLELGVRDRAEEFRFVTQIEAVSGLVVSPDRSGTFLTPRHRPLSSTRTPLWTARLSAKKESLRADRCPDPAVRVIHARHSNLSFFDDECGKEFDFTPFKATLTARDRDELLALTSGFALPSLRRLHIDKDNPGQVNDDPKGMVVRPAESDSYVFLSPDKKPYKIKKPVGTELTVSAFQEGLLVPKPFRDFSLTLSSLKGSVRSLWEGEPPAPHVCADQFYKEALNIEGYTHRTAYGRDAFVQVAYKGFKFPIGHRAALIKVTERQFRPARGNTDDNLDPTAYLIQRNMIVVKKPIKMYPALGQPDAGREFPAASVELVTVVTPDIIDPDDPKNADQLIRLPGAVANGSARDFCGEATPPSPTVGRVFWPRTARAPAGQYGNEVEFEYRLDGAAATVKSPLIFVDNTAAHDPPTMRALAEYYNQLPAQPLEREAPKADEKLRTAVLSNVAHKYAPSIEAGETSFDTSRWTLGSAGVRGSDAGAVGSADSYTMDALMEGADQPPFYPRVHRAFVRMQSLDRLLGRAQGLIETAYNRLYVGHGLDPASNPSEIFLDVIRPAIDLNLTSQGEKAGGVAQPNARLAAISRKKGMIGGQPRSKGSARRLALRTASANNAAPPAALAIRVAAAERPFDISAAEAGRFDPAEFLGGGLGEAKLLGIVPLKTIVRVVAMNLGPQLKELEEFAESAIDPAKAFAASFSQVLREARVKAVDAIRLALPSMAGTTDPLKEFYPELAHRIDALQAVFDEVERTTAPKAVLPLVGRLISASKDLLRAIENTARNPLPDEWAKFIKTVRDNIERLSSLCSGEGLDKFVQTELKTQFGELLDLLKSELGSALQSIFGGLSVADVLRHPQEALNDLQPSIYAQAFARPLLLALTRISNVVNSAQGIITWSRDRLSRELAAVLTYGRSEAIRQLLASDAKSALRHSTPSAFETFVASLDDLASLNVLKLLLGKSHDVAAVARELYAGIRDKVAAETDTSLKSFLVGTKRRLVEFIGDLQESIEGQEKISADVNELAAKREEARRQVLQLNSRLTAANEQVTAVSDALRAIAEPGSPEGKALRERIEQTITEELRRNVQRLEDDFKALARQSMDDIIARLLSGVRGLLGTVEPLAAFVVLAEKIDLRGAGGVLNTLSTRVLENLRDRSAQGILSITEQIDKLKVPIIAVEAIRNEIMGRVSGVRQCASRVRTTNDALRDGIGRFRLAVAEVVTTPNTANASEVRLQLQGVLQNRRKLFDDFQELALAAAESIQYLQSIEALDTKRFLTAETNDVAAALKETLRVACTTVEGLLSRNVARELAPLIVAEATAFFGGLPADVIASFSDATAAVAALRSQLDAPDQTAIVAAFRDVVEAVEEKEGKLLGALTTGLAAVEHAALQALQEGLAAVFVPLGVLVDNAIKVHRLVEDGLGALQSKLNGGGVPAEQGLITELIAAIAGPGLASIEQARLAVRDDKAALERIPPLIAPPAKPVDFVKEILTLTGNWGAGKIGLVTAAQIMSRLLQSLFNGQLGAFFDFSSLRSLLEEKLLDLVPTKFTQSYDWDTSLDDFPKSDPIFAIDRSTDARAWVENDPPKNDLVLSAKVVVDLRKGTRTAEAMGRIAPFQIRLLGQAFDLVTIRFKGATFRADAGGNMKSDVQVGGVKIGKQLEFVEKLQSFFSPEGNGPYVTLSAVPPAVEAGFRFYQEYILMGAMTLQNVGIEVSALLPFDQRPALFRFAFASRKKPFLISVFPYGGGGFVGLYATAKGIVGFEIQFEFGAVVAIQFGPLSAHGRVTAGIYLLSTETERVLEGFVQAIGSGQIAIFAICVNMEIRVRQENGGAMAGSATFSFSFSVGFLSFDYSVTASKRIEGKQSGPIARVARYGTLAVVPAAITPKAVVRTPRRQGNWREYRKHLAWT